MFSVHRSEAVVEDIFRYRSMKPELIAKRYKCKIRSIKFKPVHIGLVGNGNSCDPCLTVTPVIYPEVIFHGAGVCAKVAFNYLNPSYLIEWFEYQIMMEVDTVVVMLQYINDEALEVFKYYEQKGLLKILPYPIELPGITGNIMNTFVYIKRKRFTLECTIKCLKTICYLRILFLIIL